MVEGIIPIYKAAGMTSHDVVARARRILGTRRIGHTGTLDPQVTGVLPLCIGRATRMVEYIQELPKEYEAEMILGFATDTEDVTGKVIAKSDKPVVIEEAAILRALTEMEGQIEQTPPMYSAVKVDGKRLYELAREGKTVERKVRKAWIYQIELLSYDAACAEPRLKFRVRCSKGTYIRTLCVDIGKSLGVPAVMSELVRTRTGPFTTADCVTLEQLEQHVQSDQLASCLLPPDQGVVHFPSAHVDQQTAERLCDGLRKPITNHEGWPVDQLVRVYGPADTFIGIFRLDSSSRLSPVKVFRHDD
ncbi:tRNA pseudouridine(55) synthase TruB [Marinicrinis sediminis]|uniref:tRNA pseudouridine synthase B n=1 Tax=Marinicrinis sediminis TaxID=1652465 RepID=A0ABW5R5R4_9BACL